MSKIENKIEARDRTVSEVLSNRKFTVDYFQREYSWGQTHIEQLVTDLANAFLNEYQPDHERGETENYNSYYLGPFVLSQKDGALSIIDGQQRLTSLSLFLIFLYHRLTNAEEKAEIRSMICSTKYGKKSFNITVEEREECLDELFLNDYYEPTKEDNDSTLNMTKRYQDIIEAFPTEINEQALPLFVDWMKDNVILVEIIAHSDDNAYTIFETMNDRGLSLTSTEMLKGYLLSRLKTDEDREAFNGLWKSSMKALNEYKDEEDLRFFQSWFRAQYAETIRPSKKGSKNEDFENIGSFHSWFREHLDQIPLRSDSAADFKQFLNKDLVFFQRAYARLWDAQLNFIKPLEHVYYIDSWGIADSLSYQLMLAPLCLDDDAETIDQKMDLVAKYIEIFCVRRSLNFRNFGVSSIRYTMCSLTKEIRRKPLAELHTILAGKVAEIEESWDGMQKFWRHKTNSPFIKFLLARISGYVDEQSGLSTNFEDYQYPEGKPMEIEHIWANKFERHKDEFDHPADFERFRESIGNLILLPRGTNQSYNAMPYDQKQPLYIRENLLVKSLCAEAYTNNPNFTNMVKTLDLPFRAHPEFKKADIEERQKLYQAICERIFAFELPD